MRSLLICFIFHLLLHQPLSAQYQNVLVGTHNLPNEPTICINPKNTNQIVAGANNDSYYHSSDGGLTWEWATLSSSYGVWGDPVVVVDTAGSFYFFHLSVVTWSQWLDRIVCQKSTDGGNTWNDGSYMGLNGTKQQDKEWAVVDRTNNNICCSWTQFDVYGSTSPNDSSVILFSRSVDGGSTWSTATRINRVAGDCQDMDNTVEGAMPAVGPGGEVYISWAGPLGLVFTKSTDGGVTWPDTNHTICEIPGGWDFAIPGISRANGLPVTCCDLSDGPHRGTIYINWSDQRNGADDTDVWIVKSTDGGVTWTCPCRVNDDPPGKQQFFTWMTIDPVTGYLYFVFYDRREQAGLLTDVYMAVSKDGGATFNNFRVSETPFNPTASIFFGDYTNISAFNGIVRPIWTRLDNGVLGIYTAIVDSIYTGISPEKRSAIPFSLDQNYPNPATDHTYISFKIHKPTYVSLKVFDACGHEVVRLFDNTMLMPGKYVEKVDIQSQGLVKGFYYLSLIDGEKSVQKKMIVE